MDFLKKIATSSPLPAGGAVIAYTLALAIGLLNKIILLEIHRRADQPELEKNLLAAKKELEGLLTDVELLVERDVETFKKFNQSRREGDIGQIELNFNAVIEVSMKVLQNSEAAFEWIRQLYSVVPPTMLSHLLVACELIMGSIKGTAHLVRENLQHVKSSKKKENDLRKVETLQTEYQKKYNTILDKLLTEPR